jgi:transcriptional regulator with XRE-family HTH domain
MMLAGTFPALEAPPPSSPMLTLRRAAPVVRQVRAPRGLGRLCLARRTALGLTQGELAARARTAPSTISRLEGGHHAPRRRDLLPALARALEVPLGVVFAAVRDDASSSLSPSPAPLGLGALVRHHRVRLGLTRARLAAMVGVGDRTIESVQRGRRAGDVELVARLEAALGLGAGELPRGGAGAS